MLDQQECNQAKLPVSLICQWYALLLPLSRARHDLNFQKVEAAGQPLAAAVMQAHATTQGVTLSCLLCGGANVRMYSVTYCSMRCVMFGEVEVLVRKVRHCLRAKIRKGSFYLN